MEFLIIAAFLGIIPGMIAYNKGHSFIAWWAFGFAIFIVALPCSLIIKKDDKALADRDGSTRKCPKCAEWIKNEASVCKYCGSEITPMSPVRIPMVRILSCPNCRTDTNPETGWCEKCQHITTGKTQW